MRLARLLSLAVLAGSCASTVGSAPECAANEECLSGICGPDGRCVISCTSDEGCPQGFRCVNLFCVPEALLGDGGALGDGGGTTGDGGMAGADGGGGGPDGGPTGDDGGGAEDGGRPQQCHERGAEQACGPSLGTCVPGRQICTGEFWGPCLDALGPSEEQCDGRDHDCDGVPNNRPGGCDCQNGETRPCYDGPPDTRNVGTCRDGVQTCVDGRFGECVGAVKPVPRDCAHASCAGGPNPECACVVGEARGCFTGPADRRNVGVCRDGVQTCIADETGSSWGTCENQRLPEPELCDGRDHDCNGILNDAPGGCDCQTGETSSCYGGPPATEGVGTCRAGSQSCESGRWGACTGSVEPEPGNCAVPSCTGGPNPGCECVLGDERTCYTGNPAEIGVGICHAGTQRCVPSGATSSTWGTCVNERLPEAEQCDGLDHDCNGIPNDRAAGCDCQNGETRPCYNVQPRAAGGTCQPGAQTCSDGRWGACLGAVEPQPGQCSQLACDGLLNPGCVCLIGQNQSCYTGPAGTLNVGVCRAGNQTCVSAPGGSAWGPCQNERLPETETCDNQDHDCNGIPNDPAGGCVCALGQTQSCYTGPAGTLNVGTCAAGQQSCEFVGGNYQWGACTGEVKPVPGDCLNPSCTGPNDPNPGCTCIIGRTRSCYTGPAGTLGVGICVGGTQTCVAATGGSAWGTCTGEVTPQTPDLCVGAGAAYDSTTKPSDRNCNNILDRHNPVARPTVQVITGSPGTPLTPPSGFNAALEVKPLVTVQFSPGATDEDPGNTGFSYRWRLIAAPPNNTAGLSGAPGAQPTDISTQQNPTLFAQLVSDYDVGLVVTDSTGCQSAEAKARVRVRPQSEILVQLKWSTSVDMDVQMVPGSASPIFGTDACYWGRLSTSWGATLDIDDLAGCNSENIALANPPANGSTYVLYVHYYSNHRGHRFTSGGNTQAVCYETTATGGNVPVTVRIFVDGEEQRVLTASLAPPNTGSATPYAWWKPVTLQYQDGIWYYTDVNQFGTSDRGYSGAGSSTCVCGGSPNCTDPFCGPSGAGCRQQYGYTGSGTLCVP
jgi:hypothetical protein